MLDLTSPPSRPKRCKVSTILAELPPDDAEALQAALSNPAAWPAEPLAQTLRSQGIGLGQSTIRAWRRANL